MNVRSATAAGDVIAAQPPPRVGIALAVTSPSVWPMDSREISSTPSACGRDRSHFARKLRAKGAQGCIYLTSRLSTERVRIGCTCAACALPAC